MASGPATGQPLSAERPAVALTVVIFFTVFLARVALAPILPEIETELGISHSGSGGLILVMSVGLAVGLLGSGMVSGRYRPRDMIQAAAWVSGAFLALIAFSHKMWHLQLGLAGVGLACGIYLPSGLASLTGLIRKEDWGKTLAIHQMAPNLSYALAPIFAEVLIDRLGWRRIFGVYGVAACVLALVYRHWGKGGESVGGAPTRSMLRSLFTGGHIWVFIVLFSLAIGANQGIFNISTLYLTSERGLPRLNANSSVALARGLALVVPLGLGWLADLWGTRRVLTGVMLTTMLATIGLGFGSREILLPCLYLQAMAAASFFPLGFAALSMSTPTEYRSVAVSISVPASHLVGGGLLPAGISVMGEHGLFGTGIGVTGLLIGMGTLLLGRMATGEADKAG